MWINRKLAHCNIIGCIVVYWRLMDCNVMDYLRSDCNITDYKDCNVMDFIASEWILINCIYNENFLNLMTIYSYFIELDGVSRIALSRRW